MNNMAQVNATIKAQMETFIDQSSVSSLLEQLADVLAERGEKQAPHDPVEAQAWNRTAQLVARLCRETSI